MSKKYAILTRDRQSEALRVALGLMLLDDQVEVFLLDRPVAEDESTQNQYRNCLDMDLPVYSDHVAGPEGMILERQDLAGRLADFDRILPLL